MTAFFIVQDGTWAMGKPAQGLDRNLEASGSVGATSAVYPVGFTMAGITGGEADNQSRYRAFIWRPIRKLVDPITLAEFSQNACGSTGDDAARQALRLCFPDLVLNVEKATPEDGSPAALSEIARRVLVPGPGGTAISSRLPLVVLLGALSNPGGDFSGLADGIARRGYVVVAMVPAPGRERKAINTSEAEQASLALDATLVMLARDQGVDVERTALIGWSFGGIPMMLAAARSRGIRSIVSLDSAIRYQYGVDLLRPLLGEGFGGFHGAVLSMSAGVDNSVAKSDSLLERLGVRVERLQAEGFRHADFSDQHGGFPAQLSSASERERFQRRYAQLVSTIVEFLERTLSARSRARESEGRDAGPANRISLRSAKQSRADNRPCWGALGSQQLHRLDASRPNNRAFAQPTCPINDNTSSNVTAKRPD
jgi:pimeloyl-ACP methyl ester carboxylesterase